MARKSNLLKAKAVDAAKSPGRYSDGGGLYLIITKALNRKWVFRYIFDGKARELGLGSLKSVSLAQARARADAARRKVADGIDPIEEKRAVVVEIPTFGECADDYIETHNVKRPSILPPDRHPILTPPMQLREAHRACRCEAGGGASTGPMSSVEAGIRFGF